MAKYSPETHSSVVDNLRRLAKANNLSTERFSDEEIWEAYVDCFYFDNPDDEFLSVIKDKASDSA